MTARALALLLLVLTLASCGDDPLQPRIEDLDALEVRLEALRAEYRIPALSAGVLSSDGSIWTVGFGATSNAAGAPAPGPGTVFHLASLTKTFAAAIVLQLAEEGKLSLDDLASKYGISLPNSGDVRVRHLLSHTSEGTPGEQFRYNGDRFAELDRVIQRASGATFAELLSTRITGRLRLGCTGPSTDPVLRAVLVPGHDADGRSLAYPTSFSSAAGMVSCVRDLLEYSLAWDQGLVSAASLAAAWSPAVSPTRGPLPYGLGWFVDELDGTPIVWHYGLWTGNSSLIVKLPERGVTFVLLANNDQLSASFRLGAGDLRSSPFARAFLAWALQRDVAG